MKILELFKDLHYLGYSKRQASQAFNGACWRRAVCEGSLPPTVAGNLENERSRRGGEVRGEQECAVKGRERMTGRFVRGIRRAYRDVTWR